MEPKKNPKVDIHRKRGIIFNVSLLISMLLVITAFNWSVRIQPDNRRLPDKPIIEDVYYVPVTGIERPKEKPKVQESKPTILYPTEFIEVKKESADTEDELDIPDQTEALATSLGTLEIPAEPIEDIVYDFRRVEKMPEPVGGYESFYAILRKNLKYPSRASRMGVEGIVYVSFTINENGAISDLQVPKGIGSGCDEEAMRVLLLTKWNPGKQRGKPVKVRMVQPLRFSLPR